MELLHEEPADGVAVIKVTGRLNMAAAPQLRAAVDDCTAGRRARIVVDLAGITFVDSSGLGALIGGLKAARLASGDLRIAAPAEQVRTVLGLTNLDRVLRPFDTVEDALHGW